MIKKVLLPLIAIFVLINILVLVGSKSAEKDTTTIQVNENSDIKPLIPTRTDDIKLPANVFFAGERIPLEDFEVRERFEKELLINTYWQSNTLQLMKRANRYFPVIEEILKKQGVPEDFKYLALAESGLENVVSPMDARGVWQFLEPTAREYGLEVSNDVDERYHLEKATAAAAQYLKKQQEKFGSWALAAASYNAGRAGVLRQLSNQKTDTYWDLYLNTETARYVFRLAALKEILENRGKYGYLISNEKLYQPLPHKTVQITKDIPDIANFAREQGTTYKHLKILNPWLKTTRLSVPSGKKYQLRILTAQPD